LIREHSHRTKIKIPLVYADQLWRIVIWAWVHDDDQSVDRGWFAQINAKPIGQYSTPERAAKEITNALKRVGREIATCVTSANLVH